MEKIKLGKNDIYRFSKLEIFFIVMIFVLFFLPMIFVTIGSLLPIEVVLGEVQGFRKFGSFQIDNYIFVIQNTFIIQNILNSVFFVLISLIIVCFLSFFVARRLLELHSWIQKIFLGALLMGLLVPVSILIQIFNPLSQKINAQWQAFPLILLYLVILSPISIYIYVVFLRKLPEGIKECAAVDGLNWFQREKVFFLNVKPATILVALLGIVFVGNDFFIAENFNRSQSSYNVNQEIYRLIVMEQFNLVQMWTIFSLLFISILLIAVFLKDTVLPHFDDGFHL